MAAGALYVALWVAALLHLVWDFLESENDPEYWEKSRQKGFLRHALWIASFVYVVWGVAWVMLRIGGVVLAEQ